MPTPGVAGPVWIPFSKFFMDDLAPVFKICVLVEGKSGGGES